MIEALHNSPMGGHSGIVNTYYKVRQLFQWPGLKKDVMGSDICKRCKTKNVAYLGLLQPLDIRGEPWESISTDFIEGLPRSKGKDCIMVIVDRFTKYNHFVGLSHPYSAREIVRVFMDHIVTLHGVPKAIISFRDKIFTSLFWKELMWLLGVKLNMSTPYHPIFGWANRKG